MVPEKLKYLVKILLTSLMTPRQIQMSHTSVVLLVSEKPNANSSKMNVDSFPIVPI